MFERSHNGPVITRSLLWAAALLTLVMILMLFSSNAQAEDAPTLAPKAVYGIDENENTYFEYLAIEESVHVSSTRFLNVSVDVYDGQGGLMANVHKQLYLSPYDASFTIKVPGNNIMGNVAPGDFSVTVTLYDMDDIMLAQDSYAVPGFEGNDFEAPAWFSASPTDEAVDTDANGQSEYLALEAHIGTVSSGIYLISAMLTDNEGNSIQSSSEPLYFGTGMEGSIMVRFAGSDVIKLATDGPYQVELILSEYWDGVPIDEQSYTTSAYSRGMFQVAASLQGPFSDAPTDASGNGMNDYLIAWCELVVATPGTYRVGAFLSDLSGTNIDDDTTDWIYFEEAGTTTLGFHFSGTLIANSGVNGPYNVFVALSDEYYNVLSTASFTTSAYLATDFEQLVRFESYEVVMVDEDSDSLNEVLAVDAIIHFDYSDQLYLSATLTDSSGNWICSSSDWRSFSSSDNAYRFMMNGRDILSSGRVGPFYLSLSVGTGDFRDDEIVTISGYDYDDFEPLAVLGEDITESMVDEDGIGLYDTLLIEASVNINYPSDSYWLIATLRDGSGNDLQTVYGSYSFTIGPQTMPVAFDGDIIADHGYYGKYQVIFDLGISGAKYIYADARGYLTDEIDPEQFQQDVWFEGPFYDFVYDNDGNDHFDTLVVGGTLNALTAGYYRVGGQWGSSSTGIGYGWTGMDFYLEAGQNPIELYFSAINIITDGPYWVYLYAGKYGSTYSDSQEYWTAAYLGSDFERAMVVSESDQGVDLNENGLYEYLQLDIGIEISKAGDYYLDLDLDNKYSNDVFYERLTVSLVEGLNIVTFLVPSQWIFSSGAVGAFDLDIRLVTTSYDWLDWETFTTNPYNFFDFEHTALQEPMTAVGQDTNGNEKFEWLVVSCGVNSVDYNYYSLNAILKDKDGTIIYEGTAWANLAPGGSTMEVWIGSQWILQHGMDGPFTVDVTLSHYGNIDDSSVIVTADYTLAQFELPAWIGEPCSDHGSDANDNGLYEVLIVKVPIEVATPCYLYMQAAMTVAPGVEIYGYYEMYLDFPSPGSYEVELIYPGNTIYHLAEDGTYQVTIQLFDTTSGYMILDTATYTTASYMKSQFERVELSAPISDHGEDYNEDGEFDLLVVDIELYSTSETFVEVHGYLSDSGSNLITECWASIPVINGAGSVRLEFDGLKVGCAQMNGPFTISIDVYTGLGSFLLEHITQDYIVDQFEQISFTANIAEEMPDGDGDGKYEYLFVGVEASSTLESDMYLYVVVSKFYDNGGYWSRGFMNPVHILAGTQTLGISFPGSELMEEGPFNIEVRLSNSDWWYEMALVTATFETPAYPADHFEPPVGIVSATEWLDEGDLLVEIEVEVSAPGDYWVTGELRVWHDWNQVYLGSDSVNLYLEVGMQTVTLRLPGPRIHQSFVDGPYYLGVWVTGANGMWLDSDGFETKPYHYTDFTPPVYFTGSYLDYGLDVDGNGGYEALVVGVGVHILTRGNYAITGELYDFEGKWIAHADYSDYYEPGTYTMFLRFAGKTILDAGSDGPYLVQIAVLDTYYWRPYAQSEYFTGTFQAIDFEWHALMVPPPKDYGLDLDGDGLFEYLVIEVDVDVNIPGHFQVNSDLYEQWAWEPFAAEYYWNWLDVGRNTLFLFYPGDAMMGMWSGGQLSLTLVLYMHTPDGHGYWIDYYYDLTTGDYQSWMFEEAPQLEMEQVDHLVDRDMDGLYDWLAVDVWVQVPESGKFTVVGELYVHNFNDLIVIDQVSRNLKPGVQLVTLYLSAVEIWAKGWEGPYQVEFRLFDEWGNQIDEGDHYVVSEFGLSQCERLCFDIGKKGIVDLRSDHVEVIIFGSKMANAHRIDPRSVLLGDGEGWARPCKWEFKDVNHDGRDDLVLKFKSKDLKEILRPGEDVLVLKFVYNGSMVQLEKLVWVKFGRCGK